MRIKKMRIKILYIVLIALVIFMSSCVMAIKNENPYGLSKEKNNNAPGHWKKNTEFDSQKNFVDEIHNNILLRLEQHEVYPSGLIETEEESIPPVAIITWVNPVYKNTAVFFFADASYDPDGGDIVLIEWDWNGNGNYELININPYIGSYNDAGIYNIGLRVTDDEGQIATAFETVTVID
jgi:hypothetical protein